MQTQRKEKFAPVGYPDGGFLGKTEWSNERIPGDHHIHPLDHGEATGIILPKQKSTSN